MITTPPKRVAVTGLGIITAIGESIPSFRKALFNGTCGIRSLSLFDTTGFPCQVGAQVRHAGLESDVGTKDTKRFSRCDRLGLLAAHEALVGSRLDLKQISGDRIGVILGAGAGGMLSWERYRRALWSKHAAARPSLLLPVSQGTLTDLIASRYQLTGFRATVSTACSSSATAIGYGYDLITSGRQDVVVTGGSESLSELTFAGFNSLRVMDPEYCRPFDKSRRGLSLGEGAAILILEDYKQAEDRGAAIYSELLGYATNSDAFHMTSPDPEGMGMSKVMKSALKSAGLNPDKVDYINAHGTGTRVNDQTETKSIKRVFGEKGARELAISSTKAMVGHCLGSAGAIESVAIVLALCEQIVPPTIHLENLDPDCDLDYVPNSSRERTIRFALNNSFAFGGNNTSVVFGRAHV